MGPYSFLVIGNYKEKVMNKNFCESCDYQTHCPTAELNKLKMKQLVNVTRTLSFI